MGLQDSLSAEAEEIVIQTQNAKERELTWPDSDSASAGVLLEIVFSSPCEIVLSPQFML